MISIKMAVSGRRSGMTRQQEEKPPPVSYAIFVRKWLCTHEAPVVRFIAERIFVIQ